MVPNIRDILVRSLDTFEEGLDSIVDPRVGVVGILLVLFGMVTSIGMTVLIRNRYLSQSGINQLTSGGVDTSQAFPLAVTDSTGLGWVFLLIGFLGSIGGIVLLVQLFLDDDRRLVEVVRRSVRPFFRTILGLGGIVALLAVITYLASIPIGMVETMAGPIAALAVIGLFLAGLLYGLTVLFVFIPAMVDGDGPLQAFRRSRSLTSGNRGYVMIVLIMVLVVMAIARFLGVTLGNSSVALHPVLPALLQNTLRAITIVLQWAFITATYRRLSR